MEQYLLAKDVARLLGIRTSTLRKWRTLGKGPQGWVHAGKTTVVYPASELRVFLAALGAGRTARE